MRHAPKQRLVPRLTLQTVDWQQHRGRGLQGRSRWAALALVAAGGLGTAWASRTRVADALTARHARRPAGLLARRLYRDRRSHQASLGEALDALGPRPEDRLVEVGCGGGLLLELALQRCHSAKAIDHSPDMIRLAAARNATAIDEGRLELVEGDARRMPFADGDFTAAAMTDVFLVLEDPAAVLAELHRVLTQHGRLVIDTRAPETAPLMRRIGLGWMARRLRFYSDHELADLLTMAGFRTVAIKRYEQSYAQLATARRS